MSDVYVPQRGPYKKDFIVPGDVLCLYKNNVPLLRVTITDKGHDVVYSLGRIFKFSKQCDNGRAFMLESFQSRSRSLRYPQHAIFKANKLYQWRRLSKLEIDNYELQEEEYDRINTEMHEERLA